MSFTSFQTEVLNRHNVLRAKHSAQPLQLDAGLCQYAQEWANYLVSRNVMQHRSNNKYGENLYASFGKSSVTGSEAVDSWYNEIKYYRFGAANPSNFSQVGHFTQVVWKNSRRLGVGIAVRGTNVYVVCNYDPPGNYGGQYPSNLDVLQRHNELRAKHSANPLHLNKELCEYAQQWANRLATDNKLQHRSSNKYGENLYACFGRDHIEGKDAVDSWYNEVKNYTYGVSDPGSNFSNIGHFTQVVWKGSQHLGVGIASKGTNVFVVCNYDPPGNVYGRYAEHVSSR
uniref:SCP domain-containing protein n=1 Tax=Anopheles epiroticus TaxID=199890 RepID=A0A182P3P6_9DIPT